MRAKVLALLTRILKDGGTWEQERDKAGGNEEP